MKSKKSLPIKGNIKTNQESVVRKIAASYQFFRYQLAPSILDARTAIRLARRAFVQQASVSYFKPHCMGYGANKPSKDGLLCIERPTAAGLREVGASHELSSIDHTGWYMDSFSEDRPLCGTVFQMAARHGCARYVPGIKLPYDNEAVLLSFADIATGEPGGDQGDSDDCDAKREAAGLADSIAEKYAEEAREYDEAWQAGRRHEEIGEDMTALRVRIKAIIAKARAGRGDSQAPYDSTALEGMLEDLQEMRDRRESLMQGNGDPDCSGGYIFFTSAVHMSAFYEGANITVARHA